MELSNKTILIISQEEWGRMFISKHHYAVALGKLGNKVYFINPPDRDRRYRRGEIRMVPTGHENVQAVYHRLLFPFFLKYKYTWLYEFLVRIHIRFILRAIGGKADIVWSFDLSNSLPLYCFPENCFKIFMPVDEPYNAYSIKAAKSADIILSVTSEILDKYQSFPVPKHFVNHGVSEKFINEKSDQQANPPFRVGYSGGLLRQEIDWDTFFQIIGEHPSVQFEFWGEYDFEASFITKARDRNEKIVECVNRLKAFPNVVLHGPVEQDALYEGIRKVDMLMICYDINKDQSHGTNYHKVLEYLGTGNVVVSNNVSTYAREYPGILEMAERRDNNKELPNLFSKVLNSLNIYNAPERRKKRIDFARRFTYPQQVAKIQGILKQTFLERN